MLGDAVVGRAERSVTRGRQRRGLGFDDVLKLADAGVDVRLRRELRHVAGARLVPRGQSGLDLGHPLGHVLGEALLALILECRHLSSFLLVRLTMIVNVVYCVKIVNN